MPLNISLYPKIEPQVKKLFHATKTEEDIGTLKITCEDKDLKINEKKTQLLAVSTNRIETEAWIDQEDGEIRSEKTLKLLGFHFGNRPGVGAQVDHIKKRAMTRFFVIREFSTFMPGSDLKKLYCSWVRSVIEYSSVTYGPMLTQYQSNELENLQKRCLDAFTVTANPMRFYWKRPAWSL